ncbi:MAG: peptidoglycan-binding protein [Candidatus Liptonbacteria bacterium]|nr:peptidoglycan-binding protein [Candidatus Liptonbacteria bacterium]
MNNTRQSIFLAVAILAIALTAGVSAGYLGQNVLSARADTEAGGAVTCEDLNFSTCSEGSGCGGDSCYRDCGNDVWVEGTWSCTSCDAACPMSRDASPAGREAHVETGAGAGASPGTESGGGGGAKTETGGVETETRTETGGGATTANTGTTPPPTNCCSADRAAQGYTCQNRVCTRPMGANSTFGIGGGRECIPDRSCDVGLVCSGQSVVSPGCREDGGRGVCSNTGSCANRTGNPNPSCSAACCLDSDCGAGQNCYFAGGSSARCEATRVPCTGDIRTSSSTARQCASLAEQQGQARGLNIKCRMVEVTGPGVTAYYDSICSIDELDGFGAYYLAGYQRPNGSDINPGWQIVPTEIQHIRTGNACQQSNQETFYNPAQRAFECRPRTVYTGGTGTGTGGTPQSSSTFFVIPPTNQVAVGFWSSPAMTAWYDSDGSGPVPPHNVSASAAWSSDNPEIAQVGSNGNVKGIKEGETLIRAGYSTGGQTYAASARITVGRASTPAAACRQFQADLGIGSQGAEVEYLRQVLTTLGFPVSPEGDPRVFDEPLASQVSEFQLRYRADILTPAGLTNATGYFGSRTRAKLNNLNRCAS